MGTQPKSLGGERTKMIVNFEMIGKFWNYNFGCEDFKLISLQDFYTLSATIDFCNEFQNFERNVLATCANKINNDEQIQKRNVNSNYLPIKQLSTIVIVHRSKNENALDFTIFNASHRRHCRDSRAKCSSHLASALRSGSKLDHLQRRRHHHLLSRHHHR